MLPIRVRSRNLGRSILSLSLLAGLGAAGCSPQDFEEVVGDVGDTTTQPAGQAVPFQEFEDDVGTRATSETRIVIRTQQGYVSVFGHAPPAGVDLTRQWVIFYAAGTKPTGGFDANVLSITRAGDKILAVTELVSPGSGCAVTQALTSPYVLVKFAAQPGTSIAFGKNNRTHACDDGNACAAVTCPVGSKCVVDDIICVTAPCNPRVFCQPDPTATRCGGIAGILCPAGQTCVDDPGDGCDPTNGGADCGGICVGAVTHCGGIAGILCPAGQTCVDDPGDGCDPKNGDADCGGICVGAVTHCGGIAGIQCPGMGRCVDDPGDGCDPAHGGADCGGICQCVQNVLCVAGAKFDPSPKVCACVPQPPVCGPVCAIFCQYGNVLDGNGCPTCACNPPPNPPTACPPEKCTGPAPGIATRQCPDGKLTSGPVCALDAHGVCGWLITQCPQ